MEIKNRPDPNKVFPNPNLPRLCFIKNVVKNPRIIIAADHLAETSKDTAYADTGAMMAQNLRGMYESSSISASSVVQKAICRAVNARRPRTRYRIGRLSSTMVFFHWLLPTRWWDSIVRMMGKKKWI